MPGKPWLGAGGRKKEAPAAADRRRTVDAGLRQQWREGVSNTAPVNPDEAVQAAKRAIGAARAATQTAQAAQTAPAQSNAYGPAVAPSSPQGPSASGSGST